MRREDWYGEGFSPLHHGSQNTLEETWVLLVPMLYGIVEGFYIYLLVSEHTTILHLYCDVQVLVGGGTLYACIVQNQMALASIGEGSEHVQCDFVHVCMVNT